MLAGIRRCGPPAALHDAAQCRASADWFRMPVEVVEHDPHDFDGWTEKMRAAVGKPKREFSAPKLDPAVASRVAAIVRELNDDVYGTPLFATAAIGFIFFLVGGILFSVAIARVGRPLRWTETRTENMLAMVARDAGVGLQISGHTHAGQVRFPLLGSTSRRNVRRPPVWPRRIEARRESMPI